MSTTTENLGLFKYNTVADASTPFSITNALNNNWDEIDSFAGDIDTLFSSDLSEATGKNLFNDINTKLSEKLTAEVLLSENGYIKFNNLVLQWGRVIYLQDNIDVHVTFPVAFETVLNVINTGVFANDYTYAIAYHGITKTRFVSATYSVSRTGSSYYIAIGSI